MEARQGSNRNLLIGEEVPPETHLVPADSFSACLATGLKDCREVLFCHHSNLLLVHLLHLYVSLTTTPFLELVGVCFSLPWPLFLLSGETWIFSSLKSSMPCWFRAQILQGHIKNPKQSSTMEVFPRMCLWRLRRIKAPVSEFCCGTEIQLL